MTTCQSYLNIFQIHFFLSINEIGNWDWRGRFNIRNIAGSSQQFQNSPKQIPDELRLLFRVSYLSPPSESQAPLARCWSDSCVNGTQQTSHTANNHEIEMFLAESRNSFFWGGNDASSSHANAKTRKHTLDNHLNAEEILINRSGK